MLTDDAKKPPKPLDYTGVSNDPGGSNRLRAGRLSGRLMHAMTGTIFVLTIVNLTAPGGSWGALVMLLILAWGGLLGVWCILLCLYAVSTSVVTATERRRRMRSFFVAPVLLLVVWALAYFDLPLRFAFRLSKPGFDRLVQQATAGSIPSKSTRAGLYTVQPSMGPSGSIWLRVRAGTVMGDCGFLYSPHAPPPSAAGFSSRSLGENWYVWSFGH